MKALVQLFVILIILVSVQAAAAANVAVGSFGYHPGQYKQVVVYTTAESGTFAISGTSYTGTLAKPTDHNGNPVLCQGDQPCLVGDFSSFKTQGTYHITVGADRSPDFTISSGIFNQRAQLFLEVFEAFKQQGSAYHADLHSVESPSFLAMADGSFVMTTDQVAIAGLRLASAYNRNPSLFTFDNYQTTNPGAPDVAEQIKRHVQIMQGYQDAAGGTAVPYGYEFNFNCPMDYRPDQSKYTNTENDCLLWRSQTTANSAAAALHLYAAAIPAIHQLDGSAAAEQLLARAQRTHTYLKGASLSDDVAAAFGAASFMLYDYTGDASYLSDGHSQRTKVNTALGSLHSMAREHYWEEYVRHKAAIQAAGLEYPVGGSQPETFFKQKIMNDWTGGNHPISKTGEHIYVLDINVDFQHSRYMILEALYAAKAQDFGGTAETKIVADNHFPWLTGMNSVQDGDWAGALASRSFIFGIGSHGRNQHTRLVPSNFYQDGQTYPNGKQHIPGWISGALDSFNDEDKNFNYHDDYWSWKYVETTDEIVAAAVELSAYLDAQYNNRAPLARPRLAGSAPACVPTPELCDQQDNNCNGQIDEGGICAPACTPSAEVCDQQDNDCDGSVDEGDACTVTPPANTTSPTNTTTPPNTTQPACTPTTETCNQLDDDCDSQVDEGDVCAPITPPPTTESCYNDVREIPATCTGGEITEVSYSGCHTITCASGNSSLRIMACNKPDNGPEYFEMYMQERTGTGIGICLGDACIGENTYAKSGNYPLCTQSPTETPEQPQEPAQPEQPQEPAPQQVRRSGGGGGGGRSTTTTMTSTPVTATLFTYTSYSFDLARAVHTMRIDELGDELVTLEFRPTGAAVTLQAGEGRNVDLNDDGTEDIHVQVVDITSSGAKMELSIAQEVEATVDDAAETILVTETNETVQDEPVAVQSEDASPADLFTEAVPVSDTTGSEQALTGAVATVEGTAEEPERSPWLWVLAALALIAVAGTMSYRRSHDHGDVVQEPLAEEPSVIIRPEEMESDAPEQDTGQSKGQ